MKTIMQGDYSRKRSSRPGDYRKGWDERKAHEDIVAAFGQNFEEDILTPQQGGYNHFVQNLKKYVEQNVRGITSAQLRNIYALIREKNDEEKLPYIRPRLAYVAGRADKDEMRTLIYLLDLLIVRVDDKKKMKNFKFFFESVIAYHKYYGGKDNA